MRSRRDRSRATARRWPRPPGPLPSSPVGCRPPATSAACSAREQALAAEETANLIRARQNATAARETLIQRLGLTPSQAQALRLPDQLPALPEAPMDEATAGAALLENRLDVRIARTDLDRTAKSLGLTRVTSVVNGLHVAGVRNSETGESTQRGFELELPLPLFDFGDAARAGGEARYLAAFNRTLEVARNASSQVRVAYDGYRSAYDLARHYRNEVVPLHQNISEESVLQYNGMLIGVFELLVAARSQSASVVRAIEAERDFWRADAALKASLLGQPIAPLVLQSGASPQKPAVATDISGDVHDHPTPLSRRGRPLGRRRNRQLRRARGAARTRDPDQRRNGRALDPAHWPPLRPGRHLERLDRAVAHAKRRQGVPPRRRAGRARDRPPAWWRGCGATTASRPGRRSRSSRATACASSSPTACPSTPASTGTVSACPTAWTASAASTSRRFRRARPSSLRVRRPPPRHLHVPPCTPTRWCRWRWA